MGKAYNINKTVWFLNPWFDIIFLANFPIVLIVPLIGYCYLHIPHYSFYEYTAFNFPHILSGLSVVYLSQQEYKKRPIVFLVVPFVIFIITMTSYALGYSFQLENIRFYWGQWHTFFQYYYILQLYKLRNQDYLRTDRIFDTFALTIGLIHLILRRLYQQFQIKLAITTIYGISIDRYLLKYPVILTWFIAAVFILRQAYLFIRWKKINLFKILIVSMVILNYYLPLTRIKDVFVASQVIIRFHCVQYIAWVWFYHRRRFEGGTVKEAKVITCLSQSHRVALYFFALFFISIAFNFIIIKAVGPKYYFHIIIPAFAYIHFFFDGIIWKISRVGKIFNV